MVTFSTIKHILVKLCALEPNRSSDDMKSLLYHSRTILSNILLNTGLREIPRKLALSDYMQQLQSGSIDLWGWAQLYFHKNYQEFYRG
jgi:hypothetical protein